MQIYYGLTMRATLTYFCATGHSLGIREDYHLDNHDWEIARSYVLANCDKSMAYRRSYVENAQKTRGIRVTMLEAEKEAIKSFPDWFENHVNQLQQSGDPSATDDLVALANGPSKWCRRYKTFDVEHATGDNDEVIQKTMRSVLINDLYSEIHRLKQEVYAATEKNGIYIPRHRYVSEEAEKKVLFLSLN
ncbi:hypothetical protein FF2_015726 [Malus domestica]